VDNKDQNESKEQTLTINTNLLGGHARSLVSLILCGAHIHLHQAPFMPTLRFLEVDGVLLFNGMHSLGGLLNNTPGLQTLLVSKLCFNNDLEPIPPTMTLSIPELPVTLQRLAMLILEDKTAVLAALLRMLSHITTMIAQLTVVPWMTSRHGMVPIAYTLSKGETSSSRTTSSSSIVGLLACLPQSYPRWRAVYA
jgi:hypothetical protein